MIFDYETLFLGQKFEFRDNQRHRWIGKLLARLSVLSNFCRGAKLEGSATKTSVVEIEGMQMLTREQSRNKSRVTGQKEKLGGN